jgi:hypothetical protein
VETGWLEATLRASETGGFIVPAMTTLLDWDIAQVQITGVKEVLGSETAIVFVEPIVAMPTVPKWKRGPDPIFLTGIDTRLMTDGSPWRSILAIRYIKPIEWTSWNTGNATMTYPQCEVFDIRHHLEPH